MKIDITLVPGAVKRIAESMAHVTKQIEESLKSGTAIDLFLLFPAGTQLSKDMIAACDLAIKGCEACEAAMDKVGTSARLQRLMADLTKMQHDEDHGISHYIRWCEIVFHDLFGKE